jgi:hypothetical protein
MMSSTLALRFTQAGAEKATAEIAKLATIVAQVQAAAAKPIVIPIVPPSAPRGGGGGGGGGGKSSPEKEAAAAEKAAAKQAAAAEKLAAREAAALEKRQIKMENFISRQRFLNRQTEANGGNASVSGTNRIAEASAKAAAQVFTSMSAAQRDASEGVKGFGLNLGGVIPSLSAMQVGAIAATGAVVGMVKASIDGAKALAGLAAEGERLKTINAAFEKLGGSAQEMQRLRDLTGNMVGDTDLQKAMNLARLFKLPAEQVPELIKVAQGAAVAMGETTAKMLSDTFTAASRQSKMIADNMGIVMGDLGKVYDDYARKIGKTSGDQLTDAQRTQAFVAKMVAEGGRQMELATLAQTNAAEKAAVVWDNLSGNMMVAVAEMMSSMGVWDALTAAMGDLESFVKGGVGELGKYLGPVFQGLGDILPPIIKGVGALVPLLAPLGQALSVVGAVLEPMVPLLGMVSTAVGTIATEIIDFISIGLEPLLSAAGEVSRLVSDDMAAAFDRAAAAMANARAGIGSTTEDVKKQGEEAKKTKAAWEELAGVMAKLPSNVKATDASVAAFSATMRVMYGATGATQAQFNAAGKDLQEITAQFVKSGDSFEVAQRKAAKNLALIWGVPVQQTDKAATEIIKAQTGMIQETERATTAIAAHMNKWRMSEQSRDHEAAVAKLDAFNQMYFDLAERGNDYASLTSDIWRRAGDDEKKALEELDKWRADHMAMVEAAYANDAQGYAVNAEKIARVYQTAFEAMALGENAKEDKPKRSGGGSKKRDDLTPLLDRFARSEMSAHLLALADADKQFQDDLKAAGKSAEGIAAAQALYSGARIKAWADAGRAEAEALRAGAGSMMAMAKEWLDDAQAVVEMTKAAQATLDRARLSTQEIGVGDEAEGIKRRRTDREVEVALEVEALRAEWEAKSAALQEGSDAYRTVLEEHQRKVADVTRDGLDEQARADAEAIMNARYSAIEGFAGVFDAVSSEIDGLISQGSQAEQSAGYVLGSLLSIGSEVASTKADITALQEKMNKGAISETQAGVAAAGTLAAAVGRGAASVIKSEQGIAAAKALVEVGLAAASYAVGDIGGGIAHTAAAAALFVAAGRGGGGGGAARTLTPRRSAAGSDRASTAGDQRQQRTQVNIFVNPLTGQALVGAINGESQRRDGLQLNSRVIPTGPRRPDL